MAAKATVNKISEEFGEALEVYFVRKNFKDDTTEKMIKIAPGLKIDDYTEGNYTIDELNRVL